MNRRKTFLMSGAALLVLCLMLLIGFLIGSHRKTDKAPVASIDTIPVLAQRISDCSRLYTAEYQLHKIVMYDDPAVVDGKLFNHDIHINLPLGTRCIAIPVTATAKAYIDMNRLTADNIHRHGDKVEIILPDPEVTLTATRIDHEGIMQEVSLLRSRFTDDDITTIQQQGRKDIINSLPSTDILADARQSAARQLIPIIVRMGFREENVTITFRRELTPERLKAIIKIIN